MDRMDAIIVGAGVAGSAAAYRLAQEGKQILLIDRGAPVGSKNVSGGTLWGTEMDFVDGFHEEKPYERIVTSKRLSFLTEESAFTVDFATRRKEFTEVPYNGFTILRSRFDEWFSGKVEEVGQGNAMVIPGIMIDELHFEGKQVAGVVQEGDVIPGNAVVLADGINSRLTVKYGWRHGVNPYDVGRAIENGAVPPGEEPQLVLDPHHCAVGVKEVIKLPKDRLEERFQINDGTGGVAHEFLLGFPGRGIQAGGFMYTNRESISLGIVAQLHSLKGQDRTPGEPPRSSHELFEDFKHHPYIAPYIEGGEVQEYSAHLIPEGGLRMRPQLYGDGFVVAGDAAGLLFSNGYQIHGMNYAIRSGKIAADAVLKCEQTGDFSARGLSVYEQMLEESYVGKDLRRFQNIGKITENPRMFSTYPKLIEDLFMEILVERGEPKDKILASLWPGGTGLLPTFPQRSKFQTARKKNKIGYIDLLIDGIRGARNI